MWGGWVSPGSWWLSAFPGAAGHLQCTAQPGGLLHCGASAGATGAWHPGYPERGGRGYRETIGGTLDRLSSQHTVFPRGPEWERQTAQ